MERVVTNIKDGCVLGYKYFDFGEDASSKTMEFAAEVTGLGTDCTMHILIDGEDGEEIGSCAIGKDSGVVKTVVKKVTGRHSIFFKITTGYRNLGWMSACFEGRCLFELKSFVFMK